MENEVDEESSSVNSSDEKTLLVPKVRFVI
jgi:hypothetical protein